MFKNACRTCSTIFLVLLTNNITAFWRCRCRSRRRFLNSLRADLHGTTLGNLSTRRFLRGDGNRKSNLLPIHVSHRQGQPSRLCADFVLRIMRSPVKRLNDFRAFISFCQQFLYLVILKILLYHFGAFTSDCQVFTHIF